MINRSNGLREFGKFRLDLEKKLLWLGGEPVALPLKAVDLLCVLVEQPGEVISKEEIWREVWDDAFVEETNLTHNIYLLRKTFKDLGAPDLIKTIPRRGYRFTGVVHQIPDHELVLERHSLTQTTIEFSEPTESANEALVKNTVRVVAPRRRVRAIATAFAVAVLAVAAIIVWRVETSSARPQPAIASMAVLPIKSFDADDNDVELRMRLTDALITRLGGMNDIAVRPTNAVIGFDGDKRGIRDLGGVLQVDAVLDGHVQQEGDRVRVTLQLVSVKDGKQLWSGQFDGQAGRLLDLRDSISTQVLASLNSKNNTRALAKAPTANSDAYEAYLNGRYYWTKRDEPDLRRAIESFETAIKLDPNFSEAYTGLADSQSMLFNYNIDVRPEVIANAKENLRRALELKPNSADALTTLGAIQVVYDWDWNAAEETLKAATVTAPNVSIAHMRYGSLLMRTGRLPEALAESERAVDLDPLSVTSILNLGLVYFCEKDFVSADIQFRKALDQGDTVGAAHWLLSRSLWLQGRKDESITELIRAIDLDGNKALAEKLLAKSKTDPPENVIRLLLFEWRNNPPVTNPPSLTYLAASIGDRKNAMFWVERSLVEHHPWATWFYAAPDYQTLRDIPRFQEVLREMKFVE